MLLSEDRINELAVEMVKGGKSVNWLARAIEAAVLAEQAKAGLGKSGVGKVVEEWERQKRLFPELSKDGWMDLAVKVLAANFERAANIRETWPQWKREYAITKYSGQEPIAHVASEDSPEGWRYAKHIHGAWTEPVGTPLYLHPAPAPEGMVLVPREPTEEMLHEGLKAGLDVGFSVAATVRQEIYRAMIAAAEKEAGK